LAYAIPEINWTPVPNLGADVLEFAKRWKLDGLILTGGDNVGATPVRDETETLLLNQFIEQRLPVYGICRGLQFMVDHFNGKIVADKLKSHVSQRHAVRFSLDVGSAIKSGTEFVINSFHENIIRQADVRHPLAHFALAMDQTVEGILCKTYPLMAVMWHPEREWPFRSVDRKLIRWFFGLD
jgi:putative glutamine amidotransferase